MQPFEVQSADPRWGSGRVARQVIEDAADPDPDGNAHFGQVAVEPALLFGSAVRDQHDVDLAGGAQQRTHGGVVLGRGRASGGAGHDQAGKLRDQRGGGAARNVAVAAKQEPSTTRPRYIRYGGGEAEDQVGALDVLAEAVAGEASGQQETDAVGDVEVAAVQEVEKVGVLAGEHDDLGVGGGDDGWRALGQGATQEGEGLVVGHIVDADAQDVDGVHA
jgi:hypothetical protein